MKKTFHIFFILIISLLLLLSLRGIKGNPNIIHLPESSSHQPPFESSLERGRFAQTVSIAEYGVFNVDHFVNFLKPDLAWFNGHFYPAFPPGISLVLTPAYFLGKNFELSQVFTYATISIFTVLTCIVLLRIYQILDIQFFKRYIGLTILLFGTSLYSYSVTLSAHPVSAFFITTSFLIYLKIGSSKNNLIYFSLLWSILGLNFFIDYPNIVILIPIIFASFLKVISVERINHYWKIKFPMILIGSVIPLFIFLGLFVQYNLIHYKTPIAFTNTYNLQRLVIQGIPFTYDNLNNELFNQKSYTGRFSNFANIHKGINTLLFSWDRGLFFYSPIFLISLIGFAIGIVYNRSYVYVIAIAFLSNLLLYASFDDPWGGWSFGPRYLIPTLPILSILLIKGIEYLVKNSVFFWIPIFVLSSLSIAINLLGALTTNAVPPSVESITLGIPDNFILNLQLLLNGNISSFVYSSAINYYIRPVDYYLLLLFIITFLLGLMIILSSRSHERITNEY